MESLNNFSYKWALINTNAIVSILLRFYSVPFSFPRCASVNLNRNILNFVQHARRLFTLNPNLLSNDKQKKQRIWFALVSIFASKESNHRYNLFNRPVSIPMIWIIFAKKNDGERNILTNKNSVCILHSHTFTFHGHKCWISCDWGTYYVQKRDASHVGPFIYREAPTWI